MLREGAGAACCRATVQAASTDIAIDHSEFAHLDASTIRARGDASCAARHERDGELDPHQRLVRRPHQAERRPVIAHRLSANLEPNSIGWVYVGDSPNDQQMFGAFRCSVGAANLMRFAAQLSPSAPAYLIARGERVRAGFGPKRPLQPSARRGGR